jgi:hypothetical protein
MFTGINLSHTVACSPNAHQRKKEPPEGGSESSKSLKRLAGVTGLELATSGVTG